MNKADILQTHVIELNELLDMMKGKSPLKKASIYDTTHTFYSRLECYKLTDSTKMSKISSGESLNQLNGNLTGLTLGGWFPSTKREEILEKTNYLGGIVRIELSSKINYFIMGKSPEEGNLSNTGSFKFLIFQYNDFLDVIANTKTQ